VKPVGNVLGQMVPKSGRKEWLEILSELAHHQNPTDFGCHMSSRFLKQGLDGGIDTYHQRSATHFRLTSLKFFLFVNIFGQKYFV